eukprot:3420597-Amphidinium_carterae.2
MPSATGSAAAPMTVPPCHDEDCQEQANSIEQPSDWQDGGPCVPPNSADVCEHWSGALPGGVPADM